MAYSARHFVEAIDYYPRGDGMKRSVAFAFLICFALTPSAIAQSQEKDEPEANPGRPTVSTPATLTPVGYLQFETGLLQAWNFGDFTNRLSLVNVTKISFHRRLQFFAGFEPYVRFSHDDPPREAV